MSKAFFFKTLFLFFNRILFGKVRGFHRNLSNNHATTQLLKYQKYPSLALRSDLSSKTLIFNVEEVLLKSPSLFPYFMLVALEAGGCLRAIVLLLLYPLICLVSEEMGLKIMVMVCFFGIKKERFKVGRAVLPKFYLEDVGLEIFEVLKRGGEKVAVSKLPQVMVEDFIREYLEIDVVVGRELKVFHGYFVGLIEEKKKDMIWLEEILVKNRVDSNMIGISGFNISLDDHQLFSRCKEIYLVGKADKWSWQRLPKQKYPKPLIFHDGRLALRPTALDAVAIFMWAPFGFILAIFRILISKSLPTNISTPLNAFSGMYLTTTMPKNSYSLSNKETGKKPKGLLYVCNHKTLLDPVYLNVILNKSVTGVTYSVSRISETLSPIKTVRLSRNRDQDGRMVESLLNQGDVVVCPEGTTCREPYLLRFSPLFAELGDVIAPVAIDSHVTMFYGTTASGLKCLDPLFCLMNPTPMYTVQFLERVSGLSKSCSNGVVSKFDVANHVQSEIGKALGFECTNLTRRDKYLILVGNEGKV